MVYLLVLLFDSMAVAGCILTTYAGISIKLNMGESIWEDQSKKIDYEKATVTYYRLPREWKTQIIRTSMAVCGILVASCPAVFSEYIPDTHIGIWGRIIFIPILTVTILIVAYFLSKIVALILFKVLNKCAKRRGITKKIKEGQSVY